VSARGSIDLAGRVVDRLGLGSMSLTGRGTWGPPRDPVEARRLLRRAAELGIGLFDTADAYGPGVAEELLAEALHPYEGVLVATKAGLTRQGPGRWGHDGRPASLRAACEQSLRRLRVEALDLYQLHAVDPEVPLEESLGTLFDLRAEGKVRHVGVGNVDLKQLERALSVGPVASVQNRYSLADRASDAVIDACERHGLAFIAWAPLAKGAVRHGAGALGEVARSRGATPAQVALAWLLARSGAVVPIPGTASITHLEENAAARAVALDADELARVATAPVTMPASSARRSPHRVVRRLAGALGVRR
jgi:aryl-alcohol dehydrogenase-like predicted oxidoreductase